VDVALLSVGILTLHAAAAAAWFAYPTFKDHRIQPNLILSAEAKGSSSSGDQRNVTIRLRLSNDGSGTARDWRVLITSRGHFVKLLEAAHPPGLIAGPGAMQTVRQRGETALLVTRDPVVDALAGHAEPAGDLDDPPSVLHDREHRLVPLFHDAELHQHGPPPPRLGPRTRRRARWALSSITRSHRQRSAGSDVKDQPDQRQASGDAGTSSITRNTTSGSGAGRTRTFDRRIMSPLRRVAVTCDDAHETAADLPVSLLSGSRRFRSFLDLVRPGCVLGEILAVVGGALTSVGEMICDPHQPTPVPRSPPSP